MRGGTVSSRVEDYAPESIGSRLGALLCVACCPGQISASFKRGELDTSLSTGLSLGKLDGGGRWGVCGSDRRGMMGSVRVTADAGRAVTGGGGGRSRCRSSARRIGSGLLAAEGAAVAGAGWCEAMLAILRAFIMSCWAGQRQGSLTTGSCPHFARLESVRLDA